MSVFPASPGTSAPSSCDRRCAAGYHVRGTAQAAGCCRQHLRKRDRRATRLLIHYYLLLDGDHRDFAWSRKDGCGVRSIPVTISSKWGRKLVLRLCCAYTSS